MAHMGMRKAPEGGRMRSPDGGLARRRRGASSRCRDAGTAQEHGPSDRGHIRRLPVDSNVCERPVPAQRAAGPGFDLIASKLRPPSVRSDAILRPWLIERLTRDDSRPVVSVVAPPGYGKTTLLAQWAEHSSQAFAWVSVDEEDNDPRVCSATWPTRWMTCAVSGRVFGALASPCCITGNAGTRCRCWPITYRPAHGWCWQAATSRRFGSPGYGPRAGSWRSARVTCR